MPAQRQQVVYVRKLRRRFQLHNRLTEQSVPGRLFTANLLYNGVPYDIQGNILKIRGTKPDGTTFEEDPDDYERDDSLVDIMLTEQMTNVPGRVVCEIVEKLNTSDVIGSANFILDVEEPAYVATE